jgi:fibronectin type 3 domain-containing protein
MRIHPAIAWIAILLLFLTNFATVGFAQLFGNAADIGSVGTTGSSSYDTAKSVYTLQGGGVGLTGTDDAFRFSYAQLDGNAELTVRVESLQNVSSTSAAGLVLRESLNSNSASASVSICPDGSVNFAYRATTGASTTTSTVSGQSIPSWLRLTRSGTTVSAHVSADGVNWSLVDSVTLSFATSKLYAGLAASSGVSGTLGTAQFGGAKGSFAVDGGVRTWLRADTGVTVDGSTNVSTWADQSGNNNSGTQTTAANRPGYITGALNGLPVVRFVSTNSTRLALPSALMNSASGEMFLVHKSALNQDASNTTGFHLIGSGGASNYPHYGGIYDTFGSNAQKNTGRPLQPLDQYHLYNVTAKAGEWTNRINGLLHYTTATNIVGFSTAPYLGYGGYYYFSGDVAEVLIYGRALSAAERESVGNYLQSKYALASAPAIPGSVTAKPISPTQISVTWTTASTNVATRYVIERKTGSGAFVQLAIVDSTTSYIDTTAVAGETYLYRVLATNAAGASGYSAEAQATAPTSGVAMPLTGMRLWLKADSLPASGKLNIWQDESGSSNNGTQLIGANQPSLVTAVVNGRPVVRFTGANSTYVALPSTWMNSVTAGELFIVHKSSLNQDGGVTNGFHQLGAGGYVYYPVNTGQIQDSFGSTVNKVTGRPSQPLNQFHLYNVTSKAGEWTNRINGLLHYTTATNIVQWNATPTLGLSYYQTYFSGDVGEILIYDHGLTAAEREVVGNYLQVKYALVSAPATPTGVTTIAISPTQVGLSWTGTPTNAATKYIIERKTGSGAYVQIAIVENVTSYIDTTAVAGEAYTYRIAALNAAGTSSYSSEVQITTSSSGTAMPLTGMRLWLRADAVATSGKMNIWQDQSGNSNHGTQLTSANQPSLVTGALNGRPVVHFTGANATNLALPSTWMNSASPGEMFIVHKSGLNQDGGVTNGFHQLGSGGYSYYPVYSSQLQDSFGSNAVKNTGRPSQPLDQYHLYNAASKAGEWTNWINGILHYKTTTNTIGWYSTPTLGLSYYNTCFTGDIAEILVYDHTLTAAERETVGNYLQRKYALAPVPAVPAALTATALSPTQVSVSWISVPTNFATKYVVERKVGVGSFSQLAITENATSYIDTTGVAGETYTYRVMAMNAVASSAYSAEAQATTPATGTAMPLTGVRLWLRADALATSGKLNIWHDQSGLTNDGQFAAGTQPSLVNGALNSRPVVRFSASANLALPSALMTGASSGEMFIVHKSAVHQDSGLANGFHSFGSYPYQLAYPLYDGTIHDAFGSTWEKIASRPTYPLNQFHLYNVTSKTGEWTSRIGGVQHYTTATNAVQFSTAPNIGVSAGNAFLGDVAELLVYDHSLTTAERGTVNQYLNRKYALTDDDTDGLPDWWELQYFGNLAQAGSDDSDSDGLTNIEEFNRFLIPNLNDTDGDGVLDGPEVNTYHTNPLNTDTDSDTMPDGYEVANGLNPLVDDRMLDPDDDRYPNIFEYSKGTNPQLASSVPAADYTADGAAPTPLPPNTYLTIQAAANAAQAAGNYKIVAVKPGTYAENVIVLNNVALVSTDGARKTIIRAPGTAAAAEVQNFAVLDGFTVTHAQATAGTGLTFTGWDAGRVSRCVIRENNSPNPGGGIYVTGGRAYLINSIVLNNRSGNYGGAIYSFSYGSLIIQNCTITGNVGLNSNGINNSYRTVSLVNTVVWNGGTELTGSGITATYSNIQGGFAGTGNINVQPQLTAEGYLTSASPCIDQGAATGVSTREIGDDTRPAQSGNDMGADEWVDTDSDGLADWWELEKFGDLSQTGTGDQDGDGITNANEYLNGFSPTTWNGVQNIAVSRSVVDTFGADKSVTFSFYAYQAQSVTIKLYNFYYDQDPVTKGFANYVFSPLLDIPVNAVVGTNNVVWDGIIPATGEFHRADVVAFEVISNQTVGGSAQEIWSSKTPYQAASGFFPPSVYYPFLYGNGALFRNVPPGQYSVTLVGWDPLMINNIYHQSLLRNRPLVSQYVNNGWMALRDDGFYFTESGGTWAPHTVETRPLPAKAIVYTNQFAELSNQTVEAYSTSPGQGEVVHALFNLSKTAYITIELWDPAHVAHPVYYRDSNGNYQSVVNLSLNAGSQDLEFYAMDRNSGTFRMFGPSTVNGATNNSFDGLFRVKFIVSDPNTGRIDYTWATLTVR